MQSLINLTDRVVGSVRPLTVRTLYLCMGTGLSHAVTAVAFMLPGIMRPCTDLTLGLVMALVRIVTILWTFLALVCRFTILVYHGFD